MPENRAVVFRVEPEPGLGTAVFIGMKNRCRG
jgi:hypothetical protein